MHAANLLFARLKKIMPRFSIVQTLSSNTMNYQTMCMYFQKGLCIFLLKPHSCNPATQVMTMHMTRVVFKHLLLAFEAQPHSRAFNIGLQGLASPASIQCLLQSTEVVQRARNTRVLENNSRLLLEYSKTKQVKM